MKFIHIADVHLGAEPSGLNEGNKIRGKEIWESLEGIVALCEKNQVDLLLIAGDLFHRQPLMRELKEVNYLFSKLSKTKVVFIVGNHDYLKLDSYYHTFEWNDNVFPLQEKQIGVVEFKDLQTAVYGLSYHQREITESLYDNAFAQGKQKHEILLVHGGDEKHIPLKKETLGKLGYDYIAMGHIHKPQVLIKDRAAYAGALEPIDVNDTGEHGYIKGEITENGVKIAFVPFAKRKYIHMQVEVNEDVTNGALKETLRECMEKQGLENMYKFTLKGFRDVDIQFETQEMFCCENVFEITDETVVAYDFSKIAKQNEGNLLGRYIESLQGFNEDTLEYQALHLGVQALLETKRG